MWNYLFYGWKSSYNNRNIYSKPAGTKPSWHSTDRPPFIGRWKQQLDICPLLMSWHGKHLARIKNNGVVSRLAGHRNDLLAFFFFINKFVKPLQFFLGEFCCCCCCKIYIFIWMLAAHSWTNTQFKKLSLQSKGKKCHQGNAFHCLNNYFIIGNI